MDLDWAINRGPNKSSKLDSGDSNESIKKYTSDTFLNSNRTLSVNKKNNNKINQIINFIIYEFACWKL